MIGQYPVVLTKQVWSIYTIRHILKRNYISYTKFHSFCTVSHRCCMVFVCFALFHPSGWTFFVCVIPFFFFCVMPFLFAIFYFLYEMIFFLCVTPFNLLMFGFYFAFSFLLLVMLFNLLMFCLYSLRFRFLCWPFWATAENGPSPNSDDMSMISQFLNREVFRSQNRNLSSAFITFTFL